MNVLVAAASRHGSTSEIALAVAQTLERAGHRTTVANPEDIANTGRYDAAVLGSAIYMGRWMESMRQLIDRTAADLALKPVWLFSSGPLGDPPQPATDSVDVQELMLKSHALGHRTFAGNLDKHALSLGERVVVRVVGAQDGDFRPWADVREWANDIARVLARDPAPSSAAPVRAETIA
jgi:menaquinone-dependent protoporphyrinogen oxidase